jgi:hypothetical protein
MTNLIDFDPPRTPAGTFTFKGQSNPEPSVTAGALLELGIANQIWSTQPESVSVSRDPADRANLVVDIADGAFVAINLNRNRIDPERFLSSLSLSRAGDKLVATAVLDGVDLTGCLEPGENYWYLSDRQDAIDRFFADQYNVTDDGSGEWGSLPLTTEVDVTTAAVVDGRWMTVNTGSIFAALWDPARGLGRLRDDIYADTLTDELRGHLDSCRP